MFNWHLNINVGYNELLSGKSNQINQANLGFIIPSLSCLMSHVRFCRNNHCLVSLLSDPQRLGLNITEQKTTLFYSIRKFLIRFIDQGISVSLSMRQIPEGRELRNFLFRISHDNFPQSSEALILNLYRVDWHCTADWFVLVDDRTAWPVSA